MLIIDDEAHVRRMMRLTLETAGYEVGEAGDGPQGSRLLVTAHLGCCVVRSEDARHGWD